LEEYLVLNPDIATDKDVVACAASDALNTGTTYVFYYPIPGATEINYFETANLLGDKNDFSLYFPLELESQPVFNGYLERFVRESGDEVWCIVTYKIDGEVRTSNPIRLKHDSKPTEWTDNVMIDVTNKIKPKFSWEDGVINENAIYFQVITDASNNLLSGTYTYEKLFQYYNLDNVVLNVTRNSPPQLMTSNTYNFTLMAVSIDNWVNLVIQKEFEINE
jgi:hypothetical protein